MPAWLDALIRDTRDARRSLTVKPAWTAAAVSCLAIAIGADTAAFTFVNGLLLRPLPFEHPRELHMVALREPSGATHAFTLGDYRELAARAAGSGEFLAWTYQDVGVSADDGARMAEAQFVSGNYFETLRVRPFAGRFFDRDEDRRAEPIAVLNHAFWLRRFSGDPGVVGRAVRVNGRAVTIVGIAPPGFVGAMQLVNVDLYLPSGLHAALTRTNTEDAPLFGVMGRLDPRAGRANVESGLTAIVDAIARSRHARDMPAVLVTPAAGFGVPPIAEGAVVGLSGFVFILMALLMCVAGANVAALVLARGAGRTRDIAVRLALGATRLGLARQLFIESALLAMAGCAAGGIAAAWLTRLLVARVSTPFSYVSYAVNVSPDARVLAYTAVLAAAAAIVCGLAPVRHAARVDLIEALRTSGAGGRGGWTLQAMVAAQFAVSATLMAGAGLVLRSVANIAAVDPGFDSDRLVSATIDVSQLGMTEADSRRFFDDLSARLAATPGVETVTLAEQAPFAQPLPRVQVTVPGGVPFAAGVLEVGDGFFQTIGVEMLAGRGFDDDPPPPRAAIVNRSMADRLAPSGSAVGRTFDVDGTNGGLLEVVGVVPDIAYGLVAERRGPAFYRPVTQTDSLAMAVIVHAAGNPAALIPNVEAAVRAIRPNLAIRDLRTAREQLERGAASRRAPAAVLTVICVLGLLLSAIGLYGTVSYGVRQRAREIGIRLALGATPARVRRLVLWQGLRVVGIGAAAGLVASIGLTRALSRALFGVAPGDPLTLASVGATLLAAALLALWLPSRRAARVDPAASLRGD